MGQSSILPEIHVWSQTDTGLSRRENQDTFAVMDRAGRGSGPQDPCWNGSVGAEGVLLLVADGVGGLSNGSVASHTTAEIVTARMQQRWRQMAEGGARSGRDVLVAAIAEAHEALHRHVDAPMSTTLTALLIEANQCVIAHIGDSRAYLYRDGDLVQMTRDHTLVEELVSLGQLSAEDAAQRSDRNVLTRALGYAEEAPVDVRELQLRAGDRLLLCSDGLHGLVDHSELSEVIGGGAGGGVVEELLALALHRGGPDNITILFAETGVGPVPMDAPGRVVENAVQAGKTGEDR